MPHKPDNTAGGTPADVTHLVPPAQAAELERQVAANTDAYFRKTKAIVERMGDKQVTYAVFMRRPVIFCPRLVVEWLEKMAAARGVKFQIDLCHEEGTWVGAGEPLLYLTGPLSQLVDLETLYLQKLGPACVAAYNAYSM